MPVAKLRAFLDEHGVKYSITTHSPAITAQEVAESAHIPGRELAKTVIINADGRLAMVVQPASKRINLGRLKQEIGAEKVALAGEPEFTARFPDCEPGAMPPFGNLYDMEVFVGEALTEDDEIAFNAGNHTELMRLRYQDFATLVKPRILQL